MSFTSMHNDYLDPDIHNPEVYDDEEKPESKVIDVADSLCRISLTNLRRMAEKAVSFIERNPHLFACSWRDLFKHAPKGPFKWEQDEAGDWVPSEDCDIEGGWTKYAYGMDMKRLENGTEIVKFWSVNSGGDVDESARFERKHKGRLFPYEKREFEQEMAMSHCYYTLLKQALYSIHVAATGEDPLEDTLGNADPREVHLRNLAYEVPDLCASVYKTAAEALVAKKD